MDQQQNVAKWCEVAKEVEVCESQKMREIFETQIQFLEFM